VLGPGNLMTVFTGASEPKRTVYAWDRARCRMGSMGGTESLWTHLPALLRNDTLCNRRRIAGLVGYDLPEMTFEDMVLEFRRSVPRAARVLLHGRELAVVERR
jgi:hypothetical protein